MCNFAVCAILVEFAGTSHTAGSGGGRDPEMRAGKVGRRGLSRLAGSSEALLRAMIGFVAAQREHLRRVKVAEIRGQTSGSIWGADVGWKLGERPPQLRSHFQGAVAIETNQFGMAMNNKGGT